MATLGLIPKLTKIKKHRNKKDNEDDPTLKMSESVMSLQEALSLQPSEAKSEHVKYLLTTLLGVLFLAGENSGVGLLALPYSLKLTNYAGLLCMFLISGYCTYCGVILGHCCIIYAERHYDHYPHYPAVAHHAFGRPMMVVVWICLHISTIGICVADITQIALSLRDLTSISCVCYLEILTAALLMPLTYFGSPKDFWWVAYFSLGSTSLAILIMDSNFAYRLVYPDSHVHNSSQPQHAANVTTTPRPPYIDSSSNTDDTPGTDFEYMATGVSIIVFAFASISIFPTLIEDLADKTKTHVVAVTSQATILVLYIPYAFLAYLRYKSNIRGSILDNFENDNFLLKYGVSFLMMVYLVTAFVMHFNHTTLEIEYAFKISGDQLWRRIGWRSSFVLIMLAMALTFPEITDIVHLIGGSVSTLLTLIFPPMCYLKITSMNNPSKAWPDRRISRVQQLFALQTLIMGLISATLCTASNVFTLTRHSSHSDSGQVKCYRILPPRFFCFNETEH